MFKRGERYNALKYNKLKKHMEKWDGISIETSIDNPARDFYINEKIEQM